MKKSEVKIANLIIRFFRDIKNDSYYIIDNDKLNKTSLIIDFIFYLTQNLNKKGKK